MNPRLRTIAVWLVHTWVRIYTAGADPEIRERRRAEIQSDVWESLRDAQNPAVSGIRLISRLGRGIPADMFWRLEHAQAGGPMWIKLAFLGVALTAMAWSFFPPSESPLTPKMPAPPLPYYAVRSRVPPPPPPPPPTWEEFVAKVN